MTQNHVLIFYLHLTSDAMIKGKEKYFHSSGNKLNYPQTDAKYYWVILNKFLQEKNIPLIPPILSNLCEKVMLFNTFFANQCESTLIIPVFLLPFAYKVSSKIDNVIRNMTFCLLFVH